MSRAQVYLATLGCRLNEAELVSWTRNLQARGHALVEEAAHANLIVLNSCAVTAEASRKSRKLVAKLHRQSPKAHLVVTGCMAELEGEKTAALPGVDLVVGNLEKDALVERVLASIDLSNMPAGASLPDAQSLFPLEDAGIRDDSASLVQLQARAGKRTRAFVKVQDGCRNQCSYCVVTIARGQERSRSPEKLSAEVQDLHSRGYIEAVLTGVHLGGYGHDLAPQQELFQLVRHLLATTNIPRLRLSSLEPWDLPENFGELWEDQRLLPHLHLPLQSGSDSVLRRMSRRCFRKDFRSLVTNLRAAVPKLNITTDLIVGFPGETDAEFQESLEFVEEIGFGDMHIFGFSAREGTRAATLPGRVPGPLIRERSRQMHLLAVKMRAEHMQRLVGQERRVLVEAKGSGYTEDYWPVRWTNDAPSAGTVATVTVPAPTTDQFILP